VYDFLSIKIFIAARYHSRLSIVTNATFQFRFRSTRIRCADINVHLWPAMQIWPRYDVIR